MPLRDRLLATLWGLAPVALVIATFATDWRLFSGSAALAGYLLFAIAAFFTASNFYLALLRYPLHRWRTGSTDDLRFISGAPLLGDLTAVALWFLPPAPVFSALALVLMLLNTSSMLWFVIVVWLDERIAARRDAR